MIDLLSLQEEDMVRLMKDSGFPGFRGKQLFQWCQEKGVKNFDRMTNLPGTLKLWLKEHAVVGTGKIAKVIAGEKEDTIKFLFKFPSDEGDCVYIETVLMCYDREKTRDRNTVCVSTQAGCAMGCKFCASALGGWERDLKIGEIVEQVWYADNYLRSRGLAPVTNVVFMGMGEPFKNFEAVMKAAMIFNEGKNIGMRRMTISTAGIVPKIRELAAVNPQITLAVSLHAPNDELRDSLMPINRKYPLKDLMAAIDDYILKSNRRVTIEYALFNDVNDGKGVGEELADLLKGKLVNVNLLKGNPVAETGLSPSPDEHISRFAAILRKAGIETTVRQSRGKDIDGACGQLRKKCLETAMVKDDK